jgi:glycosyltransferase involved in cell wall biosynthesis
MRLLMVDQYGDLGGGQRCFLEASEGFRARNWKVYAAVPSAGPLSGELKRRGVDVMPLACGPFTATRKSPTDMLRFAAQIPLQVTTLRQIVRRNDVDAIYVNGSQVLPAVSIARQGRPVIFHVHWVVTQPLALRLSEWALRRSEGFVIATSQFVARSLGGVVAPEKMRVIYNGVAVADETICNTRKPRHVAILGRIAPEKGTLEFVRAAILALRESPDLRFTVCGAPMFSGHGYMDQVRREAEGLPIAFPGWTDDVAGWLREVDLLVVPSNETDNIPRVILEAFGAQVPVIAFRSGGVPELVEDGVTGLLTKERTPESLAGKIHEAIVAPEWIATMVAEAKRRSERLYTLQRFQSEVCETVEEAVRLSHHRAPSWSAGSKADA